MIITDAIQEYNEHLDAFTKYVSIMRDLSDKSKIVELSKLRGISVQQLEKQGIFYIGNMAEMLIPMFIKRLHEFGVISDTNNKPIFSDRWVFPIYTVDGRVQNLVGYSNTAKERYVYGTAKYYRRNDVLFGLENMEEAWRLGYAILTEGITDTISLRDAGYINTFAACGTRSSVIKMAMLNRCRHGIIRIPDRDAAGKLTLKHWITNRYLTFNTPFAYKDADETLHPKKEDGTIDLEKSAENLEWFRGYMDASINWILEKEHNGLKHPTIVATMM